MGEDIRVNVLGCIGEALRSYRINLRAAAVAGLVGAVLTALFTLLGVSVSELGWLWAAIALAISAYVYAALLGASLHGEKELQQRVMADGGRVLAALGIIGFFLFIVFVVIAIADAFVLATAAMDFLPQLQAAGQDEAALRQVMVRIAQARPGAVIAVVVVNIAIWLALTSRLFLAAPASYDLKRILTFETWSWTKGNLLRITAARILLLGPAYLVLLGISVAFNSALGIDIFNSGAADTAIRAAPAAFAALCVVANFIQFAFYAALEAALSAQIYRTLRRQRATDIF